MCRQAWFKPGDSARDVGKLTEFFAALERSCGGHGNGAGYVDLKSGSYNTEKGQKVSVGECAKIVAARPADAWGLFHTRLASAGGRSNAGCHPHVYEFKKTGRLVVLTHNGTWTDWHGACVAMRVKYPSDSATIAALISMFGFGKVAADVDETIVVAIRESDGKWRIRAWRDHYPLVLLANGGIASEGGSGEFKAERALCQGGHYLTGKTGPRTEPLPFSSVTLVPFGTRGRDGRFMPHECGVGSRSGGCSMTPVEPESQAPATVAEQQDAVEALADGNVESSDFAGRVNEADWAAYLADLEDGEWEWLKCADGSWRRCWKGGKKGGKDDDTLFLPGHIPSKETSS